MEVGKGNNTRKEGTFTKAEVLRNRKTDLFEQSEPGRVVVDDGELGKA
jgi:hypothetical protein